MTNSIVWHTRFQRVVFLIILLVVIATRAPVTSLSSQTTSEDTEFLIDARVLEIDRAGLVERRIPPPGARTSSSATGFVTSVSDAVAQSLANSPRARVLQRFQFTVSHGEPTQTRIGSRVPLNSNNGRSEYLDAGIHLQLTPRLSPGRSLFIAVSGQVQVRRGNPDSIPQDALFTSRQVQSEIRITEGETILMGGLIANAEAKSLIALPILIQSPILGHLFKQSQKQEPSEIVIMLTPHLPANLLDIAQPAPETITQTFVPAPAPAPASTPVQRSVTPPAPTSASSAPAPTLPVPAPEPVPVPVQRSVTSPEPTSASSVATSVPTSLPVTAPVPVPAPVERSATSPASMPASSVPTSPTPVPSPAPATVQTLPSPAPRPVPAPVPTPVAPPVHTPVPPVAQASVSSSMGSPVSIVAKADVPPTVPKPTAVPAKTPIPTSIPRPNAPSSRGRFTVQVGAFKDADSANTLVGELGRRYSDVFVQVPDEGESVYRVRVSRGTDLATARKLETELRGDGFDTFITTLN